MADVAERHFAFGRNWRRYLRHAGPSALKQAADDLQRLVPPERLAGATFLDIGCGSGLHAIAAAKLGADVTAIDIDIDSTTAARDLADRYGVVMTIRERDVFEQTGSFDVVYSWGVLHHTGAMWKAVDHAASLVKPGGIFAIALYQRTPFCGMWRRIKRVYSACPAPLQFAFRVPYTAVLLARQVTRGQNPVRYVREYGSRRGMNFFVDVHDWLGGYPYESATAEETVAFFDKLGFDVLIDQRKPQGKGLFGSACDEFTFVRRH